MPVASRLSTGAFCIERWIWIFLILGVVLRCTRYLLQYPLWNDEQMLAANLIQTDYARLIHPLQFNQIAPIPFLWAEEFFIRHFGFSELSLRMPAFIASVLSVILFIHVARRLLAGPAVVLAIGAFSVAYFPIRYSAEVKPYGIDLLISLGLIALAVKWMRAPSQTRWLWALALAAPLALAVSFPSVFVLGGIVAGLAAPVWQRRKPSTAAAYAAFVGILIASFALLMYWALQMQYDAVQHRMVYVWRGAFPPSHSLLQFLIWTLRQLSGGMMAYPAGGGGGASLVSLLAFIVGLAVFWRNHNRWFVLMASTMIFLGLLAGIMHRYPIGGHPRFTLYLAPVVCLTVGLGMTEAIAWLPSFFWRQRMLGVVLGLLCVIGAVCFARDLATPYKGWTNEVHRGFARWFWRDHAEALTVCVDMDLHRQLYDIPPDPSYFCFRALCDPQFRAAHQGSDKMVLPADHPLRCVVFRFEKARFREKEYRSWMSEMKASYEFQEHVSYRIPFDEDKQMGCGIYDVYLFTPRRQPATHLPKPSATVAP